MNGHELDPKLKQAVEASFEKNREAYEYLAAIERAEKAEVEVEWLRHELKVMTQLACTLLVSCRTGSKTIRRTMQETSYRQDYIDIVRRLAGLEGIDT